MTKILGSGTIGQELAWPTVGPWRSWRTRHRAHRDLNCAWAADNPCDAAPSQWEARHRILAMFGCRWTTVKSCGLNDTHDIAPSGATTSPLQPQSAGRTDCSFGTCLLAAHDMISGLSPTRPPLLHVHVPTCQSFLMRPPLEPLEMTDGSLPPLLQHIVPRRISWFISSTAHQE